MNIHEHQAKKILQTFGAPIAAGVAITGLDQAESAIASLPGPVWVVKSQIHAGGRGKGKFKELGADAKGGVRVSFSGLLYSRSAAARAASVAAHSRGAAGPVVALASLRATPVSWARSVSTSLRWRAAAASQCNLDL